MDLMTFVSVRVLRMAALAAAVAFCTPASAEAPPAETSKPAAANPADKAPPATAAPATPDAKAPPSATPPAPAPAPVTPSTKTPPAAPATPDTTSPAAPEKVLPQKDPSDADSPGGKPGNTEIEPHGSPGIPQNATTESVDVPVRTIVMVSGKSSYDDAFKSIKASIETLKKATEKAGIKPGGHPITIFSEPDDKGFKYQAAIPLAGKPDGKPEFGGDVTLGQSPSGKAIKFQHRGAYEDIDSTYDVITAYLDAKGLQVDNPYIEEYLNDLTAADDPNLQVDIYVFVKP